MKAHFCSRALNGRSVKVHVSNRKIFSNSNYSPFFDQTGLKIMVNSLFSTQSIFYELGDTVSSILKRIWSEFGLSGRLFSTNTTIELSDSFPLYFNVHYVFVPYSGLLVDESFSLTTGNVEFATHQLPYFLDYSEDSLAVDLMCFKVLIKQLKRNSGTDNDSFPFTLSSLEPDLPQPTEEHLSNCQHEKEG
jgi:hypothetical protein